MRTSSRRGLSALAALALVAGSVAIATPAQAASWPGDPMLTPANGAVVGSQSVVLTWVASPSAYSYRVTYGPVGGTMSYWYNTAPTAYPLAITADGWYQWWVGYRTCSFCSYNTEASATYYFYVDSVAPVVTLQPVSSPVAAGTWITLSGSISDATATSATVSLDGGVPEAFASGMSISTAGLATGTHTLVVGATDAVGHTGTASTTFEVDADAPVISGVAPAVGSRLNPANPVQYSASITGHESWRLSVDGDAQVFTSGPIASGLPIDTSGWAHGSTHTFVLTARDAVGNVAAATTTVVADRQGPALAFTTPAAGSLLRALTGVTGTVHDDAGIAGTGLDYREQLSGDSCGAVVGTAAVVRDGDNWSSGAQSLPDGEYCLTLSATDLLGNTSTAQSTVEIDQTAPAAFDIVSPTGRVVSATVFRWTESSDLHGVSYAVHVKRGSDVTDQPVASGTELAQTLAPGDYEWWVTATDSAGNVTATPHAQLQVTGVPDSVPSPPAPAAAPSTAAPATEPVAELTPDAPASSETSEPLQEGVDEESGSEGGDGADADETEAVDLSAESSQGASPVVVWAIAGVGVALLVGGVFLLRFLMLRRG